jgi:uncharacterized protein
MAGGRVSGMPTETASRWIAVSEDVPAEMRDGTVLRADVYRPLDRGPRPALVCRTPYGKRGEAFGPGYLDYVATARALAARGYVVVVQDVRGRYASDGDWVWLYRPESAVMESDDGYDTTEWAATLEGCDGRVGTWGNSYDGYTGMRTAGAAPPSLAAAFASGIAARMHDESRGVFEPLYLPWFNGMAADLRTRSGDDSGPTTREAAERAWAVAREKWLWALPYDAIPRDVFGASTEWLREFLRDQVTDPWALPATHADVAVPVCHLTGWWDFVIDGTVANFTGLRRDGDRSVRERHRLVIGPWSHQPGATAPGGGAVSYGPAERVAYHDLIADWYDLALDGDGPGDAPVRAFILNEDRWREFSDWPPPGARELELFLDSRGAANGARGDGRLTPRTQPDGVPSRFAYDPRDPVMSITDWATRAVDRSVLDHRRDVLVYRTEPLEDELLLVGDASVVLWVATDAVETDFTAKLVEERRAGPAVGLATGILRTRYLDGYDRVLRLEPGRPYELTIDLSPIGILLRRGTRLRLDISSSDFPNFDRNHNTGRDYWADAELRIARQTVFNDAERPSRLRVHALPL